VRGHAKHQQHGGSNGRECHGRAATFVLLPKCLLFSYSAAVAWRLGIECYY
jgi:hypothetical protein